MIFEYLLIFVLDIPLFPRSVFCYSDLDCLEGEGVSRVTIARGRWSSVDAKLICKHKGLIPDSNVKACQPI